MISLVRATSVALLVAGLFGCERDPPVPALPVSKQDARVVDTGVMLDATVHADAAPVSVDDAGFPDDAASAEDAGLADATVADDAEVAVDAPPGADAPAGDATVTPPSDGGVIVDPCHAMSMSDALRYQAILACLRDPGAAESDRRAAIDRFVSEVESGGGFPIVDGADLVFVYVRTARWDAEDDNTPGEDFELARRQTPITLAGDFNAWVATGPALVDEGLEFFHLRMPAPAPAATRSGYKLVARAAGGATVFFSDPLSRRFDYDGFGRISFLRGGTDHGHLERFRSVHATRLNNDRVIYVWLPPGYETSTARYPVLYMHDGNNIFDVAQPNAAPPGSWEVDQAVETELAAGRIVAPIVVGIPNNADRFSEYTQVRDDLGGGLVGGDAADYADFIVADVKPRVDARFRTRPDRASTGVIGSSLGGLVSFYIGAAHPTVFRFVGGMSSTFGWGQIGSNARTIIQDYQLAGMGLAQRDQLFYLDSGGSLPAGGCTSLDEGSDNYCATIAMRDALVAGGVSVFPDDPNATPLTPANVNIYHWNEAGAQHTESAWRARMFRPLRLFLRP